MPPESQSLFCCPPSLTRLLLRSWQRLQDHSCPQTGGSGWGCPSNGWALFSEDKAFLGAPSCPQKIGLHPVLKKKKAQESQGRRHWGRLRGKGSWVGGAGDSAYRWGLDKALIPSCPLAAVAEHEACSFIVGQRPEVVVIYKGTLDVWRLLNRCPRRPGPALAKMYPAHPLLTSANGDFNQ